MGAEGHLLLSARPCLSSQRRLAKASCNNNGGWGACRCFSCLCWCGLTPCFWASVSAGMVVELGKCCAPWRLRRFACEIALILHIQVRLFICVMYLLYAAQGGAGPKWEPHNFITDMPGCLVRLVKQHGLAQARPVRINRGKLRP